MNSIHPFAGHEDRDEDAASAALTQAPPRPRSFEPPLSVPAHQREAFRRLFDPEHMLAVFRRELPPLCDGPIHVATCSVRPGRSDKPFKKGQLQLVYRVGIQVGAEAPKEPRRRCRRAVAELSTGDDDPALSRERDGYRRGDRWRVHRAL